MGNNVIKEKIRKCVSWVGNIFNKFISWFDKYFFQVNKKTEIFLFKNKEQIKNCEAPPKVGQYLAAKHEANQIQHIADSMAEELSETDLAAGGCRPAGSILRG